MNSMFSATSGSKPDATKGWKPNKWVVLSPFSGLFQKLANGFEPLVIKYEQKSCFEALLGNTTKKPTLVSPPGRSLPIHTYWTTNNPNTH